MKPKSRKWFVVDLDGRVIVARETKSAAEGDAIRFEDRLHEIAPVGWRRGAWAQVGRGSSIRVPEAGAGL